LTDRLRTFARAWAAVGAWTLGLVVLVRTYIALYAPPPPGMRSVRLLLEQSVLDAGLLLAFTAIVAGLRSRGLRRFDLLALALSVAAVSFLITGILNPVLEYNRSARRGIDLEERYPFGPRFPSNILEHRAYVLENPPTEHSYSVEDPLKIPPNWLLSLFLSPIAIGLLAALMVWVGAYLAATTTGLSPPVRRNVHLAVAVFGGGLLMLVLGPIGGWVRGDVSRPGWVILLIVLLPAFELMVLAALRYRGAMPLHDSGRPGVS
jgi:hypothetical protein